jgi:large subunit ribosomal protein L23
MAIYSILKKPVTTEKTSRNELAHNRYGFIVDDNATKIDVKKAIKEIYGMDVASVNMTYVRGKMKMGKK